MQPRTLRVENPIPTHASVRSAMGASGAVARLGVPVLMAALLLGLASPAGAVTSFTGTYEAHDDRAYFSSETCRLNQPVYGMEPDATGKYPVLIWMHGTAAEGGWTTDPVTGKEVLSQPWNQELAKAVIRAAAERGFVAAY